jgi:hypothetical protein
VVRPSNSKRHPAARSAAVNWLGSAPRAGMPHTTQNNAKPFIKRGTFTRYCFDDGTEPPRGRGMPKADSLTL